MEKSPKIISFPVDEYPPTRPKIGTAALGVAMVCALLGVYYWPMIKTYFAP